MGVSLPEKAASGQFHQCLPHLLLIALVSFATRLSLQAARKPILIESRVWEAWPNPRAKDEGVEIETRHNAKRELISRDTLDRVQVSTNERDVYSSKRRLATVIVEALAIKTQ